MRASRWVCLAAPLCIFAAAILAPSPGANPLPPDMYLDLETPGGKIQQIPANCSTWHELHPTYCVPHHQDSFVDNGDGVISICDYIYLDGLRYHIQWVGPTYFLSCGPPGQPSEVWEPTVPGTGHDPTCETWKQIHPDFGIERHVDGWQDNGDGVLSECDYVSIGGAWCHIDRIGLDIFVVPGPIAIEEGTWGRIKGFFRGLF